VDDGGEEEGSQRTRLTEEANGARPRRWRRRGRVGEGEKVDVGDEGAGGGVVANGGDGEEQWSQRTGERARPRWWRQRRESGEHVWGDGDRESTRRASGSVKRGEGEHVCALGGGRGGPNT
jgi:hypothetical protein